MGSKKTTETKSNQTQTVAPPSWTMPGITDAAARVTAAIGNLPGEKYTGNFFAQPDYGAAGAAYERAAGNAQQLADASRQYTQGFMPTQFTAALPMGGQHGFRDSSQELNAAITAGIDPVMKQLTQQVLPGIRSSALDSGAYSGDRAMMVLPGQAIDQATESAQRIGAQLAFDSMQRGEDRRLSLYNAEQDRTLQGYGLETSRNQGLDGQQLQYMGLLPDLVDTTMRLDTSAGDILQQVATLNAQQEQAAIDNAKAQNQYEWQYPFQGLDIASSLLAQLSGGYGTTTSNGTQTTVERTGGLGNVVQGIAGLASMAGSFAMPGGGTALSSLFSRKGGANLPGLAQARG